MPKSTLGNLRMKGLLIVGEGQIDGETRRIVVIPILRKIVVMEK